jgi:hypothetical protein
MAVQFLSVNHGVISSFEAERALKLKWRYNRREPLMTISRTSSHFLLRGALSDTVLMKQRVGSYFNATRDMFYRTLQTIYNLLGIAVAVHQHL